MRLWNLHPCYLDSTGLVALWREGLLARKVLQNQTSGGGGSGNLGARRLISGQLISA